MNGAGEPLTGGDGTGGDHRARNTTISPVVAIAPKRC
jgi:hypothetical protein